MIKLYQEESGACIGELRAEGKRTLLALLKENRIFIDAPCGGKGSCGGCRVRYEGGAPEPSEKERRVLKEEELRGGIRLACASVPQEDSRVVLFTKKTERMRALASEQRKGEPEGQERLAGSASEQGGGMPEGQAGSAYGIAVDIGTTTIAMSLLELPLDPGGSGGIRRAVVTSVNHQRMYGADVISRIQAANEGRGEHLRELICSDLSRMAGELTASAGVPAERITRMAVAGNTTMCHLLRGLSCETLGRAPFTASDLSLWRGRCADLPGLSWLPAECVILPGISVFAGADLVAGIYAGSLEEETGPALLLDIGTNGEMALGGREGFLVTSAAAGPVFEGGGISCGMPGIPGAVTHVSLRRMGVKAGPEEMGVKAGSEERNEKAGPEEMGVKASFRRRNEKAGSEERNVKAGFKEMGVKAIPEERSNPQKRETPDVCGRDGRWETEADGYRVSCETIGGERPAGLCGTGIIDAVSELVREGLIDENGTLKDPWFETGFPVAGERIRLTQQDIRQVQMGKAAIRAGIETLRKEYQAGRGEGAGEEEMHIFLAGGFGYDMKIENAVRIGLFPDEFAGRVTAAGNSSLKGAERFLTEEDAGKAFDRIVKHAKEIHLATHPGFADRYLKDMFF